MLHINRIRYSFIFLLSVVLTACGGSGGGSATPGVDSTAPIITSSIVSAASRTVLASFTSNEAGTAYYIVQPSGGTAPTATEVKSGTGNGSATIITAGNLAVSVGANFGSFGGLTPSTTYTLYVFGEDATGNQSTVANIDITTLAPGAAVPELYSISVTPNVTTVELQFNSFGAGTVYFLAQTGGNAPSAAQVRNGNGNGGTVSGAGSAAAFDGDNFVTLTGLTGSTTYALYFIVENASGGQSSVAFIATTTTAAGNVAPTASSVSITDDNGGSTVVGDNLTGNYTYGDTDGDAEGISTFYWLRDGTAISGARSSTYTVVSADNGTTITFQVTPVAASGTATGIAVTSSGVDIILPGSANPWWTWMSGSDTALQGGTYGVMGVANSNNIPGARDMAVSWTDGNDNLWLFGGYGRDSAGTQQRLNDLWKFDGTNWTWVSGSNKVSQYGTYGTLGTAASSNVPGARYDAVSSIDSSGNLWLFGGTGNSAAAFSKLNDLWKFDGTDWTWVSGSNATNQVGTYGTKGIAASANVPGARSSAVSWTDNSGNFWLFGGYVSPGGMGNDLWKFNGVNWTWVSGRSLSNQPGSYGTKGTAASSNVPGARVSAVTWTDDTGNLWLFGGYGFDSTGTAFSRYLNDLWKFDGADWTWVSGSNLSDELGDYGVLGTAAGSNVPGARVRSVTWTDANGDLWLFGGEGYSSAGTSVSALNDLWKFDGTNWTWVSGKNTAYQTSTYGVLGTAASSNTPGSRAYAVSWTDSNGDLWLFGGQNYSSNRVNDLWRYQP